MPKWIRIIAMCIAWSAATAVAAGANEKPKSFCVIAPLAFHEALTDYIEHKQAQMPTRLVSLESVLAEFPGVDDPEKLKRFLYEAWREEGIGYALLVGDADVLPVRYMVLDRVTPAAFDYAFYPTDLYYSDLADQAGGFDDWNAQRDGFHARYFGEVRGEKNKQDPINFDGVDYLPDIAVGRWPVSTPDQAATVAAKTVAYENALAAGNKPGATTAAMLSVGGWVDSRGVLDLVGGHLPTGWTVSRRYYADAARDDGTPPPDEAQALAALNDGVGLMFHAGHGLDDRWEQCLTLRSLGRIDNADRLPVIISAGCSTARFATLPPYEPYTDTDGHTHPGTNHGQVFNSPPPPPAAYQRGDHNMTGLGEELVRAGPNGAVAYIGCNTGSQPCGLTLLEGFVMSYRAAPGARLGDCWAGAVAHYHASQRLASLHPTESWYPPSIFFQGMKFMLFGDPTLRMPRPD